MAEAPARNPCPIEKGVPVVGDIAISFMVLLLAWWLARPILSLAQDNLLNSIFTWLVVV